MHSLLQKLLQRRGIETVKELNTEEKKNFDEWEKILSKERITIEEIKQFCESQIKIIEGKWSDFSLKNEQKSELLPYHTVYKTLLSVIDSPKIAREQLEKQLVELTK